MKAIVIMLILCIAGGVVHNRNLQPYLAKFQREMQAVKTFNFLIFSEWKNTPCLHYGDRPVSEHEQSLSNDEYVTTPTCSRLFASASPSRLPFDQDPDIITPRAQQGLNEAFRADFLDVTSAVRSREQSILDCHAYHIGVTIVKYELENDSDLFNPPLYFPNKLAWLDAPPIQEAEDKDFFDDF